VHKLNWDLEGELELMKRYLDLPLHTPWITNYLLTTIFDRRILVTASELKVIEIWDLVGLAFFLALALGSGLLFSFGLAWLAWPAVAFLIWRVRRQWTLRDLMRAVEMRAAVMESVRTEIVSGGYDAEEVSRRLRRSELTVAFPSLVYPLLKLEASQGTSDAA
jgi:hypothetical protein